MPETRADVGRMRDRVRIETPAETQDSRGQPKAVWQPVGTVWAAVTPLDGRELWQAQTVQSVTTDRVMIRRRADVEAFGPKWRLVVVTAGNRILNVVSVRRADAPGEFLELLCSGEGAVV